MTWLPAHGDPDDNGRPGKWSGRIGALLGIASAILLLAAFRWAHHWGLRADAIVVAWALATGGALWLSLRSVKREQSAERLAPRIGILLAGISLAILAFAGIAFAAGGDPGGACGGG